MTSYRRAVSDDVPTVADLVERSYQHYVPVIGLRPGPMDADYAAVIAAAQVWVAEDGAALVGAIVLRVEPDHLVVENVAVDPDRQGHGIGSALLQIAEDEARRSGLDEIRLFTHELMTRNIAFYVSRGYDETERRAQQGFSRVFFSKRLEGSDAGQR